MPASRNTSILALQEWNDKHNHGNYLVPKKGSKEYAEVKALKGSSQATSKQSWSGDMISYTKALCQLNRMYPNGVLSITNTNSNRRCPGIGSRIDVRSQLPAVDCPQSLPPYHS